MPTAPATIRSARLAAGLTQSELGERLGTTQAAVAQLESPSANPTVATLERVLRAAGHRLELEASPLAAGVDEAQIAERLDLTPAERLAAFSHGQRNVSELLRKVRPAVDAVG